MGMIRDLVQSIRRPPPPAGGRIPSPPLKSRLRREESWIACTLCDWTIEGPEVVVMAAYRQHAESHVSRARTVLDQAPRVDR